MTSEDRVHSLDYFRSVFFRNAIRDHVQEYSAYYGQRLSAVYIRGSVHRNEGVVGVSDLDLLVFIWDEFSPDDQAYWDANRSKLEGDYPGTQGLGYACSVDRMKRNSLLLSQLKHDATLVFGRDHVAGMDLPRPDYFPRLWLLVRWLAGLDSENRSESAVPTEAPLRLHRLARMSVTAAAGLLRATGELTSYRCRDVVPTAQRKCPQFGPILRKTILHHDRVLQTTSTATKDFEAEFLAWTAWVGAFRVSQAGGPVPQEAQGLAEQSSLAREVLLGLPETMDLLR
jgi:hypothetical protein